MGTNTWVSGMCRLHADTPTRLFSGSTHETQSFLNNLQILKSPQQPFDILKQETIIGNSMLLVLPIVFGPDTGGICDERNQTTVFDW